MNNNIIELNNNVVYVRGAKCGALYNFNNGEVFSINSDACYLLDKYIKNKEFNHPYLDALHKKELLNNNFPIHKFKPKIITPILEFVWLEITQACNLKCIHCYEGNMHSKINNELSFDEWKSIIVQLKKLNCKAIEFIGGEPTLRIDFFKLLDFAISIGHKVHIYTNLTLFNNSLLDYIKYNDIIVHFSLYGTNAQTHDFITKTNGSFDKTIYWIKKLIQNNVTLIPSVIGMKYNQDNILYIDNFLKEIGINNFRGFDVVRNSSCMDISNILPSKYICEKVFIKKPNFSISKERFIKSYSANTCFFGKFSILPNGDITPCEFERTLKYGNLKLNTIEEILKSEILKRYWYLDFSKIEECKYCEFRFACKDCRPLSGKNYASKNPRCKYNPLDGIWEE